MIPVVGKCFACGEPIYNRQLPCPKCGYKFTVDIPVGTKSVIIAIPSTMSLSAINFRESMNMDVLSTFSISNVDVQGANGYTAIGYKVYQYVATSPFSQASHYDVTM